MANLLMRSTLDLRRTQVHDADAVTPSPTRSLKPAPASARKGVLTRMMTMTVSTECFVDEDEDASALFKRAHAHDHDIQTSTSSSTRTRTHDWPNLNSSTSELPFRFQRNSATRRSQSMRIAEYADGQSQHGRKNTMRTATLEVPDRLPLQASGNTTAFSTPPSPLLDRVHRRHVRDAPFADEWMMNEPSYSRSVSCVASRDPSPRADEERRGATGTPVRRLPPVPVPVSVAPGPVVHALSNETLVRKHLSDASRYSHVRRRFLRPQPQPQPQPQPPEPELEAEQERPRRTLARHSAEREVPRNGDGDLHPDCRVRSGTVNDGQRRSTIRRSETARTHNRVSGRGRSPKTLSVALASARSARLDADAHAQAQAQAEPEEPVRSPLQAAPIRRNRTFSTTVHEGGSKSSRSDSLSSARSTNGSSNTLADVSSLQYIDLYRALRNREQLLEEIRESFKLFDKDGDGTVSKDEIGVVMRQFGLNPTDEEIQKMISEVDEDGNGCLDFSEFSKMMLTRFGEIEQQDKTLQRVFRVFDKDGDGYIDAKELKRVMSSIGESLTDEEINEMIKTADMDGDGKVSYEEFARTLSSVGVSGKAK